MTATARAPFDDGNVRELYWRTDSPYFANQQSCEDWDTLPSLDPSALLQPGIALRIAPTGPHDEGIKAITVTENIWSSAIWGFIVYLWDNTKTPVPYTGIAGFDLSSIVGKWWLDDNGVLQSTLEPPPWHICARTQGDQLSFKLWTGTNPEPAWDDPTHVFSTTLPAGWDYAGYSGGYIGHLHEGQSATFANFTTSPLCLEPDMIGTPHCQALLAYAPSTTSTTDPPSTTTLTPPMSLTPSSTTTATLPVSSSTTSGP